MSKRQRTALLVILTITIISLIAFQLINLGSGDGQFKQQKNNPGWITQEQIEEFANDFFPTGMDAFHIPGLTFVLVQDGEILFESGYGFARIEESLSVDPQSSIMRIGSISKLFVATAVLQLAEQGMLDLDTDINLYLTQFQLKNSYLEDITLSHLLSHTAGFFDSAYNPILDPSEVLDLGNYLSEYLPPRLRPPGTDYNYSNHGVALAAFIVEEVYGEKFDNYVADKILYPLGMTSTEYLLSASQPEYLATGYIYQTGKYTALPLDFDHYYPSTSMISTASNMANFIIANLNEGCWQGNCIISSESIDQMHQLQYAIEDDNIGFTLGFVERIVNGKRLIGHSGSVRGFGSVLDLLPEHDIGYFFAFNADCLQSNACEIITIFRQAFMDQFFAFDLAAPAGISSAPDGEEPDIPLLISKLSSNLGWLGALFIIVFTAAFILKRSFGNPR